MFHGAEFRPVRVHFCSCTELLTPPIVVREMLSIELRNHFCPHHRDRGDVVVAEHIVTR